MRFSYGLIIVGFTLFSIGFSINDAYGAGFIKFDGIDGESVDKDHKSWSDLLSISELLSTNSGSQSVRSSFEILDEIVIVKNVDKSSPKLSEAIAMGKVFPSVLIDLCPNPNTDCSLSYELTNVMITSYSISGSAEDVPVEDISLNFEKITRNSETKSQTKDDPTNDELEKEKVSETTKPSEKMKEDESIIKPKPRVPGWVQSTAQFWVDENVSDREFTDAIGYLVKEKIIDVEVEPQLTEPEEPIDEEPQVPAWIAQSTKWWIDGQVPEDQFLEGIKWMIQNKIITGLN